MAKFGIRRNHSSIPAVRYLHKCCRIGKRDVRSREPFGLILVGRFNLRFKAEVKSDAEGNGEGEGGGTSADLCLGRMEAWTAPERRFNRCFVLYIIEQFGEGIVKTCAWCNVRCCFSIGDGPKVREINTPVSGTRIGLLRIGDARKQTNKQTKTHFYNLTLLKERQERQEKRFRVPS